MHRLTDDDLERLLHGEIRLDPRGPVRHFHASLDELHSQFDGSLVAEESEALKAAQRLSVKAQERMVRAAKMRKRIAALERELEVFEQEAHGYQRGIEALLDGVVKRLERPRDHEGWAPWPLYGFRIWTINDQGLHGAFERWPSPELTATCRSMGGASGTSGRATPPPLGSGTDPSESDAIPHSNQTCGPPSCGIYAVKEPEVLLSSIRIDDYAQFAIGLVALTGRVVEHALAYRAQHARVVAMSAVVGRRMLRTDDQQRIFELFADPNAAAHSFPDVTQKAGTLDPRTVAFLKEQERKNMQWTSENNDG